MNAKIKGNPEHWENGTLGTRAEHARRVSADEAAAIDKAAGTNLQLISIRMPADLLRTLKEIANHHGIGYQPMIRDLLDRWATGEIKTILNQRLEAARLREAEQKASAPLAGELRGLG